MANHKWEYDKCVKCGMIRSEIKSVDNKDNNILMYQYSENGINWTVKRPDCKAGNDINIEHKPKKSLTKQDYQSLLKNPKWQRKRLEIMQRDEWLCKSCGDNENELHVHHLQYSSDKPWEEPDENLITLCDRCHKALHYLKNCDDIGIETFVLVCRLLDEIETYSIEEFFRKQSLLETKGNG